jgi:hypothetical protein
MPTDSQTDEENDENRSHDAGRQTTQPPYTADYVKTANSTSQASACAPHAKIQRRRKTAPPPNDQWSEAAGSLQKTLGVGDERFAKGTLFQLLEACREKGDEINKSSLGFAVSVIADQRPKDPFEIMLINQICGLNDLVMRYIGALRRARKFPEIEIIQRTLNKLARTLAGHVDLLHRYRSGGEQRVTVQQNVSVNEGGQAIVGNVTQNPPAKNEGKAATSPAALTDARATAMPIIEANEQSASVPLKKRAPR